MDFFKKSGSEEGWRNQQVQREFLCIREHMNLFVDHENEQAHNSLHNIILITSLKNYFSSLKKSSSIKINTKIKLYAFYNLNLIQT